MGPDINSQGGLTNLGRQRLIAPGRIRYLTLEGFTKGVNHVQQLTCIERTKVYLTKVHRKYIVLTFVINHKLKAKCYCRVCIGGTP